ISDIAHGLARVARWNGQTYGEEAFSVAQHSLIVEQIFRLQNPTASHNDCQMALLHDAPEYVIGDMISPFKSVVGGGYKTVELRLAGAVHFGVVLPPHPSRELKSKTKTADSICACFEATERAGFSLAGAQKLFGTPRGMTKEMFEIAPLGVKAAQDAFIKRF